MIAKFCSITVLVNEYTFAGNKNLVPFANSLLAIFDMSLSWCIKLTFLGALNMSVHLSHGHLQRYLQLVDSIT